MAKFLDGPECRFVRTGDTQVELHIYAGEVYTGLEPRRLFPTTGQTEYISLLDDDQKEVAIIRRLDRLDPDSRAAVEGCLAEYYMIPKITAILGVVEKYGVLKWHTETDHGPRTFQIRNRRTDIKMLYDGRVLVRDSNDNRYEIENVDALDRHSQRLLFNET
ncbi:MAG: DUF1854 domain-containing protein [Ruminococcaceae bacterium]|nr:DUF1854 domain-containing protein [Oscillospiraceae bacterium]